MTESKFPWIVSAEEEYQRNPQLKKDDVLSLKQWIISQEYIPKLDEEMLIHLLHACYFNEEKAKTTLETLYSFKNSIPEFFNNWDTNDAEFQNNLTENITIAPLPHYDPDGNRVTVCKLHNTDPANFNFSLSVKSIVMGSFLALWTLGTQKGYVLVYDTTDFTMVHLLKVPLSLVRNYINFGEKASPLRVLKIAFINTGPVIKKMLNLMKPLLSKELLEMFSFHASHESFFKDYQRDNIPSDYDGEAPSLRTLHTEYIESMFDHRKWFIEEEKLRCDDSKRPQKSKNSPKKLEKFRHLDID